MLTQNKKTFSLVDLIVVVIICAIILAIGFVLSQWYFASEEKDSNCISTFVKLEDELD
jgi:Tfp pilus assembly protein FimT